MAAEVLLFDLEDGDEFVDITAGDCHLLGPANADALAQRVEGASRQTSRAGTQLLADVKELAQELGLGPFEPSQLPWLASRLLERGHDVRIREALGGGSECFRSLRHSFLVVRGSGEFEGMEFLVEPALRAHFTIPHPSPDYEHVLSRTPDVFVGGSCRLVPIVQLLCALMADSFERQDLALPPWRKEAAMLSKWLPNPARFRDLPPPCSTAATATTAVALAIPAALSAGGLDASSSQPCSGRCSPVNVFSIAASPTRRAGALPAAPAGIPTHHLNNAAAATFTAGSTAAIAAAARVPPALAIKFGFDLPMDLLDSGEDIDVESSCGFDAGSPRCSRLRSMECMHDDETMSFLALSGTSSRFMGLAGGACLMSASPSGGCGAGRSGRSGITCGAGAGGGPVVVDCSYLVDISIGDCSGGLVRPTAATGCGYRPTGTGMLPSAACGTGAVLQDAKMMLIGMKKNAAAAAVAAAVAGQPPPKREAGALAAVMAAAVRTAPATTSAMAAGSRGVETLPPAHPHAPAIHLVRLGSSAWTGDGSPQEQQQANQQALQRQQAAARAQSTSGMKATADTCATVVDSVKSWLPWKAPHQHHH